MSEDIYNNMKPSFARLSIEQSHVNKKRRESANKERRKVKMFSEAEIL
jgi:hypothetical protein